MQAEFFNTIDVKLLLQEPGAGIIDCFVLWGYSYFLGFAIACAIRDLMEITERSVDALCRH